MFLNNCGVVAQHADERLIRLTFEPRATDDVLRVDLGNITVESILYSKKEAKEAGVSRYNQSLQAVKNFNEKVKNSLPNLRRAR